MASTTKTKPASKSTQERPSERRRPERSDHVVRAIANPLRQRILRILNERVASPKEIAEQLDLPVSNVSYHARVLLECQCIELVRTEPRRGAVEHFYRALERPMLDDEQWKTVPPSARRALFGQTLSQIFTHVEEAAVDGGFEHDLTHVSWTTLELDERGWQEMSKVLARTLERATAISAASMARLAKSGDGGSRTELAMMHFRRAEKPAGKARRKRS